MRFRIHVSLVLSASFCAFSSSLPAQQPGVKPVTGVESFESALELQIVTHNGGRFTGLVASDGAVAKAMGENEKLDGASLPSDLSIRLESVNGMQGSMGLKQTEVRTIEVLAKLDKSKIEDRAQRVRIAKEKTWEKERERLAEVNSARSARDRAEEMARVAAELEAARAKQLSPEQQQWIDDFPPSDGWIPALKQQIYHQTIILNNRPPTDQERAWLDSYDAWKAAYDAWLVLEKEKRAAEEKAKALGQPEPTGADKPEPSGTSTSGAAGIDPENPTPEESASLPVPLQSDVKPPVAIGKDVAKPSDLKKTVAKPVDLKNGTKP